MARWRTQYHKEYVPGEQSNHSCTNTVANVYAARSRRACRGRWCDAYPALCIASETIAAAAAAAAADHRGQLDMRRPVGGSGFAACRDQQRFARITMCRFARLPNIAGHACWTACPCRWRARAWRIGWRAPGTATHGRAYSAGDRACQRIMHAGGP